MNLKTYFWYLFLISGSTYLLRAVPFVLVRKKIENRFVQSFLYYIPYAVLTAMTIPAVFYATDHVLSAGVGVVVAVLLAMKVKDLTIVAVFACLAVFLTELVM